MQGTEGSWGDGEESTEFPGADFGGGGTHTEVRHVSWSQRIGNSIAGMLAGIGLFLVAFVVLYWNEGRLDMSTVAKQAVAVAGNAPAPGQRGKLVAVTGTITSQVTLGDHILDPGPYVALRRSAEMYAWYEKSHTETKKEAGGSETKVTTYSYAKNWTSSPATSRSFKRRGYDNPNMMEAGGTYKAADTRVGVFTLDAQSVDMPAYKKVRLTQDKVRRGDVWGDYVYLGGYRTSPRIGDVRLSYEAVASGQKVTLFGYLAQPTYVAPYTHKTGDTLYRAIAGTKAQAVSTLKGEHTLMTWGLRLLGFGLMWGGLMLMSEPLNVLLDVLPFLGTVGRGLTGMGTFLVALVLSTVTILVAVVLHNLVAMIVVGVATLAIASVVFSRKKPGRTRAVRRA